MTLPKLPFHIYWISLERRVDRKSHMESILINNEENHTRINAIDYKNNYMPYNVIPNLSLQKPQTGGQIGCMCSHIIALYTFISTSTDEFAFIAEDDVNTEFCQYWKPYHYELLKNREIDIIQLQLTSNNYNNPNLTMIQSCDAGTTFYRIRRSIAEKIVCDFFNSETNTIDLRIHNYPFADTVIWSYGKVYLIPMISYLELDDSETNCGSEILNDYWKNYFFSAKQKYLNYWKELI